MIESGGWRFEASCPNLQPLTFSYHVFPTYTATRYVTPLREGGSLPAVLDTEDGGLFVAKFRGAGQGARVLVAELLAGELARRGGLPVPDLALLDLASDFGRTERDPEIQDLLRASEGLNVGMRFLPHAFAYDPVASAPLVPPALAARIVAFDAFATNLDRTTRNPNLLVVDRTLWCIDHGASFYFHHNWSTVDPERRAADPFPFVRDHVLLPLVDDVRAGWQALALTPEVLDDVLGALPDALLCDAPPGHAAPFHSADEARAAYRAVLAPRLRAPEPFLAAAEAALAALRAAPQTPLSYRR